MDALWVRISYNIEKRLKNEEERIMAIFKGAGVAIVTPMNEDMSVNYEKLEELVEYHVNNGTDAIIICGTTG